LGAVIRTVNAAGADAVMLSERRAAGLTEVVERTAAGALAYVRVIRVNNLSQGLERLKKSGYWIYGLDERGEQAYDEVEYLEPSVLVFGAEGRGLHQHVRNRCDVLVRIPMSGKIASLNVSVAAGVTLFEWRRRSGREK
jgi:23S rRNA (guanosine2251-2'-O)-methyltransferase